MSTIEDNLSVSRFMKLVDKCRNKQEVLDLCEKSIKKYRPEALKIEVPPEKLWQSQPPLRVKDYDKLRMETVKLRHFTEFDETMIARSSLETKDYLNHLKVEVIDKLSYDLVKNELIQWEQVISPADFRHRIAGTLEVVKP